MYLPHVPACALEFDWHKRARPICLPTISTCFPNNATCLFHATASLLPLIISCRSISAILRRTSTHVFGLQSGHGSLINIT
jgi:hypothetical protein